MPETLVFYLLSAIAIGASALVIGQRNPMYSVLLLIASFGALAGLYIQLQAPFVAVAQIIIYAGAIMVLFLFVVMLLNAPQEDAAEWDRTHPLRRPTISRFGGLLAALLVVQLAWALLSARGVEAPVGAGAVADTGSVRALGRVLFSEYVFAFEATSVLILVAMLGAVVLARREGES
ncbi:MAG: NADH-quinone oxidoreductase subunit J [Acidobacteria bacterium]|nr:NADH-quinone oxidoreductase subunit J [Acidobacteriota bacterium]